MTVPTKQPLGLLALLFYLAVPVVTFVLVRDAGENRDRVILDVVLATIPMVLLAAVTWRLVWPRWKLAGKLLLHPCIYAVLSVYIGHWSVLIAWLHQGLFGLGGHIWFSRKNGFTWYAVEDPERYVALSKQMVNSLSKGQPSPP